MGWSFWTAMLSAVFWMLSARINIRDGLLSLWRDPPYRGPVDWDQLTPLLQSQGRAALLNGGAALLAALSIVMAATGR
jgi:hypothetical protein